MAPGVLRELLSSFFPTGGLAAEQQEATVGSGRLSSLGPALDVVAQHPILGGGYGTRIPLGPNANSFIVDDMWLSLGMEVGIVGVAVWLWVFIAFIRRSSRAAKEDDSSRGWLMTAVTAAVLAYAIGMLTFDTLSFIQVTFLLVIILALGTSQIERGSDRGVRRLTRLNADCVRAPRLRASGGCAVAAGRVAPGGRFRRRSEALVSTSAPR